jgi:hypothetical protein
MKFGDMICYKAAPHSHDGPIMYLGRYYHSHREGGGAGLIDMLGIPEGTIDHKDPSMWQLCTHFEEPSAVRVFIDGHELDGAKFEFHETAGPAAPFGGVAGSISFKPGVDVKGKVTIRFDGDATDWTIK